MIVGTIYLFNSKKLTESKKFTTILGFGNNSNGELNIPKDLKDVAAIDAGYNFALALNNNGTVIGWGTNDSNQMDIPNDLIDVINISAGYYHSIALKKKWNSR